MKYSHTLSYKLKKALPAIGMMGTILMTACEPTPEPDKESQTIPVFIPLFKTDVYGSEKLDDTVQTSKIEISINPYDAYKMISMGSVNFVTDTINKYSKDKNIKTIYLVPEGDWSNLTAQNITALRNHALRYAKTNSPKVRGKGDFDFGLGEASKVPEDSLWYIRNGWTINKYR